MATTAYSQPPSPRSEVAENQSTTNQNKSDYLQSDDVEGVEYLTRGPLHEAFAEPYSENPEPSLVVQQPPPEPIDEVPPEYRPDGKDVVWIPGYWSWDDEREDFIWISGVWRDLPPGQRWIPGYWDKTSDGFQYISGFWASNEISEVQYLPEPPESLEQGPSSPAPGEDYFYVPGSWVYETNDYKWQPGFWSATHADWVWVPTQYVWTPRGCVQQAGYWDHDVAHRGVLFTPVYYSQPVYQNAGYSYRPRYTIDTSVGLFVHLFVRPSHRQYYFGDYYGSGYSNSYYPWATRYQGNRHYDPFYASYHNRAAIGGGNNPLSWITNQYQAFAANDQYRPARTIAAQRQFLNSNRDSQIDPTILRLNSVGESLDALVRNPNSDLNLRQIDSNEVDRIRQSLNPLRQLSRERLNLEGTSANAEASGGAAASIDGKGSADTKRGDRYVDGSLGAGANADGRGSLRLPSRDRGKSSPVSDLGAAAGDLLNGGQSKGSEQRNDPNLNQRGDAAMQRARDQAERARDAVKPNEAGETANSIRERMKRVDDQTREKVDSATNPNSPQNSDRQKGLNGASDRVRNELDRQSGRATGQTDRLKALRPETPQNWPSRGRRNADRALPERPQLNNPPGNQPGNLPGNLLNRGGNANPGRAKRNASESAAPPVQKGINKASKGAKGGGKAVQDAVKGAFGG